ncbi:hypothetical protein FOL47_008282 [Perkinsus chesapeaki]|uniref:Uncharacterized protein n=1 Tax=Perkinsus chesapeaki TaxID=330153 RepID=A0A7J6LF29_PERCH|nr:hypothetical protein FOL47_008282 [Perkinsus chesapeaki]
MAAVAAQSPSRKGSLESPSRRGSRKVSVGPTEQHPEIHKNRHGAVAVCSREAAKEIIRLGAEEENEHGASSDSRGDLPKRSNSTLTAPGVSTDFIQSVLRSVQANRRRKKEIHAKAMEQREADAKYIRNKVERFKEMREERFQRLLKALNSRTELKDEITNLLDGHTLMEESRRYDVWKGWTEGVWDKIQRQCDHLINTVDKNLETHFSKSKTVTFSMTDEPRTTSVDVSRDPTKWSLYSAALEDRFARSSRRALSSDESSSSWSGHPMRSVMLDSTESERYATEVPREEHLHSIAPPSLLDPLKRQGSVLRKHRSRPVLEPMEWGSVRLKATSCGQLARLSAPPGVEIHSRPLKRMDGFVDAEDMQASAAGLRRTSERHRDLGILAPGKPFVRKEGQSALYKDMVTYASCGAPCQGHFHFPTSKASVDREFPRGKKMWETPPGTVPGYLIRGEKKGKS